MLDSQEQRDRERRDRRWVERIQAGDHDAFGKLFHAYAESLCAFAVQHVGEEAAEDIVQTVFCDLWNRREAWDPKGTVRAYLFRAVRNTSLDHLKHRRVRRDWKNEEKERGRDDALVGPADELQHQELNRAMQHAVANLPERRRLVYVMAHRHGMSYKEIAAALDIAPKTVENQIGRALKTLRDRLAEFASLLLL